MSAVVNRYPENVKWLEIVDRRKSPATFAYERNRIYIPTRVFSPLTLSLYEYIAHIAFCIDFFTRAIRSDRFSTLRQLGTHSIDVESGKIDILSGDSDGHFKQESSYATDSC